jgi:hypothetical protein
MNISPTEMLYCGATQADSFSIWSMLAGSAAGLERPVIARLRVPTATSSSEVQELPAELNRRICAAERVLFPNRATHSFFPYSAKTEVHRISVGEGGLDTGLARLCAVRHMALHGRLSRLLNVWVAPLTGATPFLLAQERCAKEGHPTSGFRFAQLPSLRRCSGGRLTWAIPGPLSLSARASCFALPPASMQSSPHPCGSSPYATPPLGLLTGPGRELARFPQD